MSPHGASIAHQPGDLALTAVVLAIIIYAAAILIARLYHEGNDDQHH